mmetsp:Transcript_92155/g.231752  ORF Transcript_92155/g.231752 Transcript_92155/m.231752 type:complete len:111 (+) Transcript_92155:133-465(+)
MSIHGALEFMGAKTMRSSMFPRGQPHYTRFEREVGARSDILFGTVWAHLEIGVFAQRLVSRLVSKRKRCVAQQIPAGSAAAACCVCRCKFRLSWSGAQSQLLCRLINIER